MSNDQNVMVKALRPFEGAEGYKDNDSEPFEVTRQRLAELKANGLVVEAAAEGKEAPAPENKKAAEPSNKVAKDAETK